jgi:hypothetical protein
VPPNADDTMELPIFREVESAWFRTKQPRRGAPQGAADQVAAKPNPVATAPQAGPAKGAAPAAGPRMGGASVPGTDNGSQAGAVPTALAENGSWRTAADDGWRAASAAADVAEAGITNVGLPKRVPMAQLVPGGVETATTGTRNRSPDAVRGLLSAYHRGVQRGRQSSARTSSDEGPGKEQA